MRTYPDISYVDQDDLRKLDIYMPDGDCKATVIWAHGGGLEELSRKDFGSKKTAQLCEDGIALVTFDYRMYPQAVYPEFIEDCALASKWVFDHAEEYGLSKRIFFGGSSAGAYLTLMLCFARSYLEAVKLKPEDFSGFISDAGQPTTHFNVLKYRGEDSRLCIIDEAAPLYHIRDARPDRPLMLIYAERDMPSRPEQNRLLYSTLRDFGYDKEKVDLVYMEGYGHCGYNGAIVNGRCVFADMIKDFIEHTAEK